MQFGVIATATRLRLCERNRSGKFNRKVTVLAREAEDTQGGTRVGPDVEPGFEAEGPPSKPKYYPVTDREQYREKVKKNPGREVK